MSDEFVRAQLKATYQRIHEAVALMLEPTTALDEARWLEACAERETTLQQTEPDGWPLAGLKLSATETRVLWLLIAHEMSPTARVQLRELETGDSADLSRDVVRRVVYGSGTSRAAARELAVTGTLQRGCLVETVGAVATPAHRLAFRIAPRLLALVDGELEVDPELRELVVNREVCELDALVVDATTISACRAAMESCDGIMVLSALAGSGRRSLWSAIARAAGRDVLTFDARRFSTDREVADRQVRVIARECALLRRVPLILNLEGLQVAGDVPDRIDLVEAELAGLVLATSAKGVARRWVRPVRTIELKSIAGDQRADLWSRALPGASRGDADLLATMYPLAPALVSAVGRIAVSQANGEPLTPEDVSYGLRSVLDHRLAGLAKRVEVTQQWDDLILPDDQTAAVVELLARIRARRRVYEEWGFADKLGKGLGVTALFSGPPGTGKSMCAGLIAKISEPSSISST